MRALLVMMLSMVAAACSPASAVTAVNVAINTGIALGAAGVRRSRGECYTPCDHGMVCNLETGLCERRPCDDECADDERCVTDGRGWRCVPEFLLVDDEAPLEEDAPPADPSTR